MQTPQKFDAAVINALAVAAFLFCIALTIYLYFGVASEFDAVNGHGK